MFPLSPVVLPEASNTIGDPLTLSILMLCSIPVAAFLAVWSVENLLHAPRFTKGAILIYISSIAMIFLLTALISHSFSVDSQQERWNKEAASLIGKGVSPEELRKVNLHNRVAMQQTIENLPIGDNLYTLDGRALTTQKYAPRTENQRIQSVMDLYDEATPSQRTEILKRLNEKQEAVQE